MKANELRIGNWVYDKTYTRCEVIYILPKEIGIKDVNGNIITPLDYIKPIPLTEEWLERFGFIGRVGKKEQTYFEKENIMFPVKVRYWDGHYTFICGRYGRDVEYVHDFQNRCFALTGEELNVTKKRIIVTL